MRQALFGLLPRALAQAAACAVLWAFAGSALANSYEEAGRLYKAGQHAKALEQIDKHLAGQPRDAQGRFLKGIILNGMNRPDEALAIFKKLTEDYPDLPEPYNNLAVIYAKQKQYDKARDALELAIRTHPAYATAYENLGDIHSLLASQAYGKALQFDAANASAQTKLALINDLVGNAAKPGGATRAAAAKPSGLATATIVASPDQPAGAVAKSEPPVEPPKAEAKPPEAQPAPARAKAAEPAQTPTAGVDAEIAAAIDRWLAAWSNKDVAAYLASYADDFEPPKGQSRQAWKTERAQRVGKPGRIDVSRDKLGIKAEGGDRAVVRFRQHYVSSNLKSSSTKTLVMVRRGGAWLIRQERSGG